MNEIYDLQKGFSSDSDDLRAVNNCASEQASSINGHLRNKSLLFLSCW